MNKVSIFILGLVTSFCFGFAFKTIITKQNSANTVKVTGIGGIFFKCKDPKQVREWYKTHLGIDAGQYGANFAWRQDTDPTKKAPPNGPHFLKQQNISILRQKTL